MPPEAAPMRVTRAASKRPRRSCTAPGYKAKKVAVSKPRAAPVKVFKSKHRARSSFLSGLETSPHIACCDNYPGHTWNDDWGSSSVNVRAVVPKEHDDETGSSTGAGISPVGPSGLAWLRPRRTFSLWDLMAARARAKYDAAQDVAAPAAS